MPHLKAGDGVRLYYEHHVPPEGRPRRATVVFSCAYCTTHENWRDQVAPLVAAGHPVVLWDLRGHGASDSPTAPDAFTIERVVDDLRAIADATSPDAPIVAAGLSFGGLASLHFQLRHPERVAALVLVGSGPGFKNAEAAAAWAAQVERTASFLESRGFAAFVAGRAGATCVGLHPERPAAQRAARAIEAQDVVGVARFGREVSGPAPSVIDALASMDVPALVLVGELDQAFRRAAEVMAAKLPRGRLVVIPGAGHIVNLDEPARFEAELQGFLAGAGNGSAAPTPAKDSRA